MFTIFNLFAVELVVVLAVASAALLLLRGPERLAPVRWLQRVAARIFAPGARTAVSWWAIATVVGVGYAVVAGFDVATGRYDCAGTGSTADPVALLRSGQAFWSGGNPFLVSDCGASTEIPYGLAAVLVNALGSLGGLAGVAAVWGLLSVAIVPLVWYAVPEPDRRYVTLFVVLLPIYFPLVAGQIDGASNAVVPVAVLLTVVLAGRWGRVGEVLGGFLSTARFFTIFPVVASRGSDRRWFTAAAVSVGAFAATTAATYARYGSSFYHVVFVGQVNRRSFSLNAYGILLDHHLLPTGLGIVAAQALLIVAVTGVAFFLLRSPLRAAAFALTGFALLTPFLSFSILLALIPVALVGQRERWWLWGAALVGALNYDVALNLVAWEGGNYLPTELLDGLLTLLLLGLAFELWRGRDRGARLASAAAVGPASAGG